jgi:hypothetical protein
MSSFIERFSKNIIGQPLACSVDFAILLFQRGRAVEILF